MEGPIEDEVRINIRSVQSLLQFRPDINRLANSTGLEDTRIVKLLHSEALELKRLLETGFARLHDLEAYLIVASENFKEAFEEYKELYNRIYHNHSKGIQQVLDREFGPKVIKQRRVSFKNVDN